MAGPGRPILYKPANGELARKFCLLGATNEDLAGLFDVAVRTPTIGSRPSPSSPLQ